MVGEDLGRSKEDVGKIAEDGCRPEETRRQSEFRKYPFTSTVNFRGSPR